MPSALGFPLGSCVVEKILCCALTLRHGKAGPAHQGAWQTSCSRSQGATGFLDAAGIRTHSMKPTARKAEGAEKPKGPRIPIPALPDVSGAPGMLSRDGSEGQGCWNRSGTWPQGDGGHRVSAVGTPLPPGEQCSGKHGHRLLSQPGVPRRPRGGLSFPGSPRFRGWFVSLHDLMPPSCKAGDVCRTSWDLSCGRARTRG